MRAFIFWFFVTRSRPMALGCCGTSQVEGGAHASLDWTLRHWLFPITFLVFGAKLDSGRGCDPRLSTAWTEDTKRTGRPDLAINAVVLFLQSNSWSLGTLSVPEPGIWQPTYWWSFLNALPGMRKVYQMHRTLRFAEQCSVVLSLTHFLPSGSDARHRKCGFCNQRSVVFS